VIPCGLAAGSLQCIFLVNAALVFIGPAACPALLFKLILFNNIKSA